MSSSADPLADRIADWPARRVLGVAAGFVLAPLFAIGLFVTVAEATARHSPLSPGLHQAVVGLPAVLASYAVARRLLLRMPASWFLAGRPGRRVLGWAAVGLALPAGILAVELAAIGATRLGTLPGPAVAASYLATSLAAGLLAGVLEELPLRGGLLRLLEARWGPRAAVAASAAVFAGLHQGHASGPRGLAFVLASMLAAGLLLGVVVVRTRSVWNAVALHAGWNAVFGGRLVSVAGPGAPVRTAVLSFRLREAPVWLTGGEATLGAAPPTTAALLVAVVVVAWLVRRDDATARPAPATRRSRSGARRDGPGGAP
ncbi:MAG: type II CAAX prenyl endopeptidase Rce1 family protein [Halobacteriales archaeon]